MGMRTTNYVTYETTVDASVEVDLDELIGDNLDEVLACLGDDELMREANERGLIVASKNSLASSIEMDGCELKRFLCDVVGLPYLTSKEIVLEMV